MRPQVYLAAVVVLFCVANAVAGEPPSTQQTEPTKYSLLTPIGDFIRDDIYRPVEPFQLIPGKDANDWTFVLEPYAWAIGLSGDVGVKGLPTSHVQESSRAILQHLDWGIFARGEIRKGRWGVLADGLYAALSGSASFDNRIFQSANVNIQQSLVSLALAYRVVDDRRGFLDLYAGARYNYFGLQASSTLNDSRIDQIGSAAADAIANRIRQDISAKIESLDFSKLTEAELLIRQQATARLERKILEQDADLRELVRDGVVGRKLTQGRVAKALEQYVRAEVQARANSAEERLQSKAAAAKKKLAVAVADEIKTSTPTYASGNEWWIDPIIGLRGHVNFTRWLYLAAQADVGGFSVGSQIAWNLQSTLGINFTRNIFAELGYRYYYVDYENAGFIYNMNSYGIFSSVGFKF